MSIGSGEIYKFTPSGDKTTFGQTSFNYALAVDANGNLFASSSAGFPGEIYKFTPSGDKTTFATFGVSTSNYGLTFDADGNLFAGEYDSGTVYKFTPSGDRTTFANASTPFGLAFDFSSATSTAVPEPFTIIGTLVGGTAALRMRKKLKSSGKV